MEGRGDARWGRGEMEGGGEEVGNGGLKTPPILFLSLSLRSVPFTLPFQLIQNPQW